LDDRFVLLLPLGLAIDWLHLQHFEDGVAAIEELDHLVVMLCEQEVDEEADHHVRMGFNHYFVGPGLSNHLVLNNLELLQFLQIILVLIVFFLDDLVCFIIEIACEDCGPPIESASSFE